MGQDQDTSPPCDVSEKARAATTNCQKAFRCLAGQCKNLCPVEYCVSGEVHFIRCLDQNFCSYQSSFGDGHICNCPIRKELFNRYGV